MLAPHIFKNNAGNMDSRSLSASFMIIALIGLIFVCIFTPIAGYSADNRQNTLLPKDDIWKFSFRTAYIRQFSSDLDDSGSFSMNRFFVQGGATYAPAARRSISIVAGYGLDSYDFTDVKFAGSQPWQDIHSYRFSLPIRWGMDQNWTILAVPALQINAENGTDWDNAVSGGGFIGFTYRINDRLVIGPGLGIFSQLEDTASLFPIILVSWSITDQLSLNTGSGFAATRGPGLFLQWKPTDRWEFQLGGRYNKARFRLDDDGPVPEGIGENTSYPLIVGTTFSFTRALRISLLGGMELGGELRLENQTGTLIEKEDYDPAGFLGLMFQYRQ